ncbi:MAG: hypothetical protein ISR83_06735 [Candidatus Marinimicrobia bacterium]|nr:hypothetical protein [Candidatus Neomarinimicrobiota bacterium]
MLVARLIPFTGKSYKKYSECSAKYDACIDSKNPLQLFGLWGIIVSGMSFGVAFSDRYSYWSNSGWMLEGPMLIVLTAIYILLLRPRKIIDITVAPNNLTSSVKFSVFSIIMFVIGAMVSSTHTLNMTIFLGVIPYVLSFLGGAFIFALPIQLNGKKGVWDVSNWHQKKSVLMQSFILMLSGMLSGFYLDDPIISTVSMIALPFPLIAYLYPAHIRHIQRARFFPMFILLMFLSVRIPWFLIPLAVLFFLLRTFYYFRYGIIYPSFGVDHEEIT